MEGHKESKNGAQEKFAPFIPASQNIAEVSWRAVIVGALIAIVFGIANAYLGLKFGLTVSASLPAAVIGMAIFAAMAKAGSSQATVLENNIVQTIGSSGESLAAGVIFTIPAFFIWSANQQLIAEGYTYSITQMQVIILSLLGGVLGILLMIPLRKYLVEKEHGKLAFPEGTACAEIIKAGDQGGSKAKLVFTGIGIGAGFKLLYNMCKLWPESVSMFFGFKQSAAGTAAIANPTGFDKLLKGGTIGVDATPALLGVGYIIGPKIAGLMLSGSIIGYLVLGPLLSYIGSLAPEAIIPPATVPLSGMDYGAIRGSYIKYIGVGAVAVGGFVSLFKSLPAIISSFGHGIRELFGKRDTSEVVLRTSKDLSMRWVFIGVAVVILTLWTLPGLSLDLIGVILAIVFGFFFVVVAARIVGIVGSSSSPVSGMTIATLLLTCLILMQFGITGVQGMVAAMTIGTVVCIAVCMSGDIAQDLKTGYLLGATPYKQQLVEFVGLALPALSMGAVLFFMNDAFGFVATEAGRTPLQAPQANVMATLVAGIMHNDLPWGPIIIGGMLALGVEFLGASSLPFAIGLYLPFSLNAAIMCGGTVAWLVNRSSTAEKKDANYMKGVLVASGLVAGDALIGVAVAFLIWLSPSYVEYFDGHEGLFRSLSGSAGPLIALVMFALVGAVLYRMSTKKE